MKRKINDFFAPLAKKPSVVSHILQARDPNLPEAATVIKKEPKDVKFVIKTENEFCEIAKKDKSGENAQPVKKTDATSPKKKSSVVKPSPQDLKVLRSLGKDNIFDMPALKLNLFRHDSGPCGASGGEAALGSEEECGRTCRVRRLHPPPPGSSCEEDPGPRSRRPLH